MTLFSNSRAAEGQTECQSYLTTGRISSPVANDGNNALDDSTLNGWRDWRDLPDTGIREFEFDNDTTNDTLAVPDTPLWPWAKQVSGNQNPEGDN